VQTIYLGRLDNKEIEKGETNGKRVTRRVILFRVSQEV